MTNGIKPPVLQIERPTEPNPETIARFKKDSFWQIIFPVLLTSVISLSLVALLYFLGGPESVSIVTDYSIFLLFFVITGLAFVVFISFALVSYLIIYVIREVPPYTHVGHKLFSTIYTWTDGKMNFIADLAIKVNSIFTGLEMYLKTQGISCQGSCVND